MAATPVDGRRMRSTRLLPTAVAGAACGLALLVAGCRQPDGGPAATEAATLRPAQAVEALARALRDDDPDRFARLALTPALHAQVVDAWSTGRSRWPMDELPLDRQWPRMLTALSAPDAEKTLGRTFDRQLAGADAEVRLAAVALGQFGLQVVRAAPDYTDDERAHALQLLAALGAWAEKAPLADRDRGHAALATLAAAARASRLGDEAAFARLGMAESLAALGRFTRAGKTVLAGYGLDLDAALDGLQATLEAQTGDRARVRIRYTLAGTPVDATLDMERHDGHWYVGHLLRHAAASVATAAPALPVPPQAPAPGPAAAAPASRALH